MLSMLNSNIIIAQSCSYNSFINNPETNHRKPYHRKNIDKNLKYFSNNDTVQLCSNANILNEIGRSYLMLGILDSTIFYYIKASKCFIQNNNYEVLKRQFHSISGIYEIKSLYDSAVCFELKQLEYNRENGSTEDQIYNLCYLTKYSLLQENYSKASDYIQEVLDLTDQVNDQASRALLYSTIADYFFKKENYIYARKYYNKALNIFDSTNVYKNIHLERLVNLSITEIKLNNDSIAIKKAKDAINYAIQVGYPHQKALGYTALGQVYKSQDNIDSAICMYLTALQTGCIACPDIRFHEHIVELGKLYFLKKDYSKSMEVFEAAYNISLSAKTPEQMALSSFWLGKVYFEQGDLERAKQNYMTSYNLALKYNFPQLLKLTTGTLSEAYFKGGETKLAYRFMAEHAKRSDELLEILNSNKNSELEFRIAIDDYVNEKEKEWLSKEIEAKSKMKVQRTSRNSAIILAFLFACFGTYFFINYRRKKRDNKLLWKQKEEIKSISKELHEADKSKLRFFTNLSHEFRTPLSLILLPIEKLLESVKKDDPLKKQFLLIYNNTNKLKQLTNQIIDLQKIDEGNLSLDEEKIDFVHCSWDVVKSFEEYCYKLNCTLKFYANCTSAVVISDFQKYQAILNNLLSNAFKYNKKGGKVTVVINVIKNKVKLQIIDTGIGISKENLEKIFQRYYKIKNDNTNIEGTGIGLSYVKEIVDIMNGNIHIDSILGQGTTITIDLPLKEIDINDNSNFERSIFPITNMLGSSDIDQPNHSENSLLIVEDNIDLQNTLKEIFNLQFIVYTANNGKEGMALALKHIPDLIISDIMMPEMDGNKLCQILKQDVHTSHIPVILLTAMEGEYNHITGYQSGADDYIVKPFNAGILQQKVKNVIATREAFRNEVSLTKKGFLNTSRFSDIDKDFTRKCIEVIEKNIDNTDFTVDNLASKLAFSNRNFYRKTKALLNLSPLELIKSYKMQYAANLLSGKNMRVSEVAGAIGFEDAKRFSQSFKKHFGVTPSEYFKSKV